VIYLIRTFGRGKDKTALKIGFTDNIWARLQHYREHNPFFELISQRPGDEILETKLHLFLTAKGYKEEFLSEWFIDCSGVLELFHATLKKIDKTIWKQRNNLFERTDFKGKGGIKARIYESLRMTKIIHHPKQIDLDWKVESNQKLLKQMKSDPKLLD
jgi:hypothetical protein